MNWALACTAVLMLHACGDGVRPTEPTSAPDSLQVSNNAADAGVMNVGGKLFSIPSPMETALLIRKLGMPYGKELPLAMDRSGKFATQVQKALALGVYGADLAYVTIHRDGQQAMRTLQTVERLSSELDLSNAFDRKLADRFKQSLGSEDSLLHLTGSAFRSAQEYLKRNSRDDVSTWVLAGGWVESMYLTLGAAGDAPAQAVVDRVGEQRRTLNNLVILLEASAGSGGKELIDQLKALQAAYGPVESSYAYVAPKVDAANKTTYIQSTSSITIPPATLKAIQEQILAIRSAITA